MIIITKPGKKPSQPPTNLATELHVKNFGITAIKPPQTVDHFQIRGTRIQSST